MSCIVALTNLNGEELLDLFEARHKGTGYLQFSKDTFCGTFNTWSGSGGLGIELEKPLVMPISDIYEIQIEGAETEHGGYTVDAVFGLVGDCWNGEMTYTANAPDLVSENMEELLNYIKSIAPKEDEENN